MATILAKQSLSWAVLVANGVPKRDRADAAPGVLLGAWRSLKRSMFQPDLAEPTRKVLRY